MTRVPVEVRPRAAARIEVLDGLRFVAALAVVAYHFTTLDRIWGRRADQVFPDQTAAYGWLGVYLFFLVSGFVIGMSSWDRGPGAFLWSRAVRLYPAYWLSVAVITAVAAVWPVSRTIGWDTALVNLTMFQEPLGAPPVAEVYWTLWAELRFYLLFLLVVWWGPTYRRVAGFCLAWLAAVTAVKAFVPDGTLPHVVLMTDYAPLFTGGVACYLVYRFRPTLLTWGIVVASFLLSLPAALYRTGLESYPGEAPPATWPAVVLLAVCFAAVLAVAHGGLRWVRGRWLVVLGGTSYPLYLLHSDLGGPLLYRWQWAVPPPLLVVVVAGAMVLLAWLVHRYVERPVQARLRAIARARTTSSSGVPGGPCRTGGGRRPDRSTRSAPGSAVR
jgi:peptidoglycan/LPS O-acetylase OafA/YrhL